MGLKTWESPSLQRWSLQAAFAMHPVYLALSLCFPARTYVFLSLFGKLAIICNTVFFFKLLIQLFQSVIGRLYFPGTVMMQNYVTLRSLSVSLEIGFSEATFSTALYFCWLLPFSIPVSCVFTWFWIPRRGLKWILSDSGLGKPTNRHASEPDGDCRALTQP